MASKNLEDCSIRTSVPQDVLDMSEEGALKAAMSNRKLAMWQDVQKQLHSFAMLRASDPEKAMRIYEINEQLLVLSANGSFRKLQQHVDSVANPKEEILTYYVVRAFKAALLSSHLMVAGYIIDQGYPFNKSTVPNVLLEIFALTNPAIRTLKDQDNDNNNTGEDAEAGKNKFEIEEEQTCAIIEFLIAKNSAPNSPGATGEGGASEIAVGIFIDIVDIERLEMHAAIEILNASSSPYLAHANYHNLRFTLIFLRSSYLNINRIWPLEAIGSPPCTSASDTPSSPVHLYCSSTVRT